MHRLSKNKAFALAFSIAGIALYWFYRGDHTVPAREIEKGIHPPLHPSQVEPPKNTTLQKDEEPTKVTEPNPHHRVSSQSHSLNQHPWKGYLTKNPILSTKVSPPDSDGTYSRITVVQTSFKYPLVRIEEQVNKDPGTGEESIWNATAMVADHLIVSLNAGYSEQDLNQLAKSMGYNIRRVSLYSSFYLVSFDGKNPETMGKAISEFKKSNMIASTEPDYLVRPQ